MSVTEDSVKKVFKNIEDIYDRRRAAVYALSLDYAAKALAEFKRRQPRGIGNSGDFWTNQSSQAADRVFSDAYIQGEVIGWFLAHAVDYGVYLELANDRQNEALTPIIRELAPKFRRAIKDMYGYGRGYTPKVVK